MYPTVHTVLGYPSNARRQLNLDTAGLPPPLDRLLRPLQALPDLCRRTSTPTGVAALAPDWLPLLTLARWRLVRAPEYADAVLTLGAPAWPTPLSLPAAPHGTTMDSFSVRLGTHLLIKTIVAERA